jgi:hypothetical protein
VQCEEVKPIHLFHALNHLGHILDLLLFIENLQTQIPYRWNSLSWKVNLAATQNTVMRKVRVH